MSLPVRSASETVAAIASGELAAADLIRQTLATIDQENESLNAFISVCSETALRHAESIDADRAAGKPLGPLAGLPIAIKDGICTAGQRTTAGSNMLHDFVPPYDATIVSRLRDAGAICIGKANMDEFAMGSSTENSFFGVTKNPYSSGHVAGGSSGGSSACVGAGQVTCSIGSDTGGSIRQPAAFCGITGLKPTYGRVSRFGLIAFASSLDQIGPMAASAQDVALITQTIAGHDVNDSTSSREVVPDYVAELDQSVDGLRIGICKQHFESGLDDEVRAAVDASIAELKSMGASLVEIDLPYSQYAVPTYYVVAPCEASSNLSRYDGVRYTRREPGGDLLSMFEQTRQSGFGEEVKRRIMLGTYSLSSGYDHDLYQTASKVRRLIRDDYNAAFQHVDLILGPTTPTTAFAIGQHTADPLAMYLADIYTVSANLAGVPAISLPCGFSAAGLPIGLQLQAPQFEESRLLRTAHRYQQRTDWHLKRPSV